MTTGVHGPTRARIEAKTLRTDRWWVYPLTTFVVFFSFVVYATIRAFQGSNYYAKPYLSPFYSPCLRRLCRGQRPTSTSVRAGGPSRAALLILIFPLGFRLTCYYYRKAYYRSFWLRAAGLRRRATPHDGYTGETPLPAHPPEPPPLLLVRSRWSFLVLLTCDAMLAFRFAGRASGGQSGSARW